MFNRKPRRTYGVDGSLLEEPSRLRPTRFALLDADEYVYDDADESLRTQWPEACTAAALPRGANTGGPSSTAQASTT